MTATRKGESVPTRAREIRGGRGGSDPPPPELRCATTTTLPQFANGDTYTLRRSWGGGEKEWEGEEEEEDMEGRKKGEEDIGREKLMRTKNCRGALEE